MKKLKLSLQEATIHSCYFFRMIGSLCQNLQLIYDFFCAAFILVKRTKTCYNKIAKEVMLKATQKDEEATSSFFSFYLQKILYGLFFELFPRIKPFANTINNHTYRNSRKNVPKEVIHKQHLPSSREWFKERLQYSIRLL